jgi:hypothetical protein
MIDDDLRRLITNQKSEHSPHAFKSYGRSGVSDFIFLMPRLRSDSFPRIDLEKALDLIDNVRETHRDCKSCSLKIIVFCELFTYRKHETRYAHYRSEYDRMKKAEMEEHVITEGIGRDYRSEIANCAYRALGEQLWRDLKLPPRG